MTQIPIIQEDADVGHRKLVDNALVIRNIQRDVVQENAVVNHKLDQGVIARREVVALRAQGITGKDVAVLSRLKVLQVASILRLSRTHGVLDAERVGFQRRG